LSFIQEIAVDYNRYEFEKYQFSQHLDIGAGVRKLAADIQQLLNNDRELNCERKRAYKINKKLSTQGLRSGCNNNLATASFDGTSSLRPATYSDTIRPGSVDDLSDKIVTHKTGEFESDSEEEEVVVTSRSEKNKKRSNECEVDLLGLDTLLMSEPEAPHDAKISTAPPSSSSPSHNSFTRARQEKMVATI
jgi:hypothetical protein